ncbi:hypothetical protein H0H81_000175 [Sphagnurus paluster]|uniref:Uncharacterized protein n=1 Tax=Sphagnurus paluster TaxID=117069 RepID=A0A9P7K635_9AGAR|nr:hypothetical protein H0H81_000175 [Sphagnurus paluster]
MFFFHNKKSSAPFVDSVYDPASVPSAPILHTRTASAPCASRVHWWDSETLRTTATSMIPPYAPERLPLCGFFPPSSSYDPAQEDLPWMVSSPPKEITEESPFFIAQALALG